MTQWVYSFGDGSAEGKAEMKNLLGGKGANLAEMSNLCLPVPPGFTITTDVCTHDYANGETYPADLKAAVDAALARIGELADGKLGDPERPLLVSVRSGARVSMPGMMDTVLNLGLNPQTTEGLAKLTGNPRFAYDSYRRFIQMYSNVVLGVEHAMFEEILDSEKEDKGFEHDTELEAEDLKRIAELYKAHVKKELGKPFPDDVHDQLWGAITAVFGSWHSARANTYRRLNHIPEDWGTAVNVQAMVFGNRGETSATGVAFTRDPSTGEHLLYGEFLINAQGVDVVAGIRTPQPIPKIVRERQKGRKPAMEEAMPEAFAELSAIGKKLEAHYRDMQDVEFTVQEGKLFMLQTRSGKRTAEAALKVAVDMVSEGVIDQKTAVGRVDPSALDQLLHPTLDPKSPKEQIAAGLAASPGAATGEVAFTADEAEKLAADGHDVILVRTETSPEDIHGMHAVNVFRTGFRADQNDVVAIRRELLGFIGGERHFAGGGARRRSEAGRDLFLRRFGIERGMEQLVERGGIDTAHRRFLIDHALAHHIDGDFQRRFRRALAAARLEHEELALLHREFHVLHVAVMRFEFLADGAEFGEGFGHRLFHRGLAALLPLAHAFGNRLRRTNTGDDILALRVDEKLAVQKMFARRWIAREGDAGGGGFAAIAEHHGLHVDRRAPIFRYVIEAAIGVGPRRMPGAEHGGDGAPKLIVNVVRKRLAQFLLHMRLVKLGNALEVFRFQLGIVFEAFVFFFAVEDFLEHRVFHAQHDVGIHLDEAAIGIVGETRIAGEFGKTFRRLRIEAEIQHRIHHARHGDARAGTHADQ